ncbi:MAG: carbohydrate porin [Tildeniella nuda ZEHNDER 1965/U140]|jgi:hypothetical protein|nr:carbohydrate porin [Tildeniella nuda ZEHNDER 1965/U140]
MTFKTRSIARPVLPLLKPIRLKPRFHLGFTFAILLTTGAAETLIHCPSALADLTKLNDRKEHSTDSVAVKATNSNSVQIPVVKEQQPVKAMPQVVADAMLSSAAGSQSLFDATLFDATKLQIAARAGLLTPSLETQETQTSYIRNASYEQRPWLKRPEKPEQTQRLTERSPLLIADSGVPAPSDKVLRQGSEVLGVPSVQLQGVFKQEGSDTSARARLRGFYPVTPNAGFGAEVDLTTGRGFADSQETGLNLNELYFAGSLPSLPTLRLVVGLMDLTSYFDRNSFAKDGATHFFNSVFQTNPALAAAGIASRPGLLVNWSVTDDIDLKATTFSSNRNLGDFHLDAFAGEVGVRFGTAIIRGTYVSSRDAGRRSGFREIFDIPRSGRAGPQPGDREEAYGINAEVFIPSLKLGLFGRYGHYTNLALDTSGTTYSAGLNFLDVFMPSDRLGLGYGRQLSNDDLRRSRGDNNPDVLELFYDFRITPNLRAAVMLQERNGFSETVLGVRVRTDFDLSSVFRRSR